MAITKEARKKIFSLVQNSKDLLVKEVESQLEQYFGIHTNGSVIDVDLLTSKDADKIYTARILRQRLKYIQVNQLSGDKSIKDAIRLLISEEAFTILNRFACLRMAEERNIIRESVRKAYNSEGFLVFDSITGQGQITDIYTRYTWYLNAVFDELSIDLPALFDRFSPFALVFPSEQALIRLLDILNNEEITIYREEGLQPVNLWREDETIGWIYQYYNSREEITEMREASSAPRNSRELAVRNQFFTPRYVVQLLTDNSLGRIWYDMTQGQTNLVQICTYLIHRNSEVFLQKGKTKPEHSDSEIQYIDYRAIKDPREIKMLDPACGSMHFGLYAFDIFEQIYIEAWDKYPNLLTDLRDIYTRAEFIAQIPVLIIRHNIHGVDIDPRALQIAGLSLWLRAQKSFDKLGLQPKDRPTITRANLVLAEPMPGNENLLNSLLKPLDLPMQQLVRAIWEKMQLAGETGLLLKIEQEISIEIAKIAKEWAAFAKQVQAKLGDNPEQIVKAKQAVKYSQPGYWQNFFDTAEHQVLEILKQLSEQATNGEAFQTLLFAEDAQRGFAFIELCRQQFDVIVMNPPFGASSVNTKKYIDSNYILEKDDLAAVFLKRVSELLIGGGIIGCISTRTIFFLGSFDKWRIKSFPSILNPLAFVDFGDGVLEAMVETAAYLFDNKFINGKDIPFVRLLMHNDKESELKESIKSIRQGISRKGIFYKNINIFDSFEGKPFAYWISSKTLEKFKNFPKLEGKNTTIKVGLQTGEDFRFLRNYWEVKPRTIYTGPIKSINTSFSWIYYTKTDFASPFFSPITMVVNWRNEGEELMNFYDAKGKLRSVVRSLEYYGQPGISYMLRSSRIFPYAVPENCIPTAGRSQIFSNELEVRNLFAFVASNIFSSLARIKGEKFGWPKFQAGMLQAIPVPNLNLLDSKVINAEINSKFTRVQSTYLSQEPYLEFIAPNTFLKIEKTVEINSNELISTEIEDSIKSLYDIDSVEYKDLTTDLHEALSLRKDNNDVEEGVSIISESYSILQYLLGVYFSRYDLSFACDPAKRPDLIKIFEPLKSIPLGGIHEKSLDYKNVTDNFIDPDCFGCSKYDVNNKTIKIFEGYFEYLTSKGYPNLLNKILDDIKLRETKTLFLNPNLLFDYHLKIYTQNKRISPIYWPISTLSGSYTIWLYYPALNDQTLFSAVNNYLKPKINDTETEISKLENNVNLDSKGVKQLNELIDFKLELLDFEKEILRIAQLPYIPNHDDGVLITAAPLYTLFRHSKWRKSTEACWKALEKGDYDWAHLAYTIWPSRVKTKCKKDLSMAIAHGLEDICDIKPKEKETKKVTEPKEKKNKQSKLDL